MHHFLCPASLRSALSVAALLMLLYHQERMPSESLFKKFKHNLREVFFCDVWLSLQISAYAKLSKALSSFLCIQSALGSGIERNFVSFWLLAEKVHFEPWTFLWLHWLFRRRCSVTGVETEAGGVNVCSLMVNSSLLNSRAPPCTSQFMSIPKAWCPSHWR